MNWENISREEQETVINIDYYDKTITVYTSRKKVAERLIKKVGQPNHIDTIDGKVADVVYKMPLSDKRVRQLLLMGNIIGGFRFDNEVEQIEEDQEDQETEA